jgi:hypothetical protein
MPEYKTFWSTESLERGTTTPSNMETEEAPRRRPSRGRARGAQGRQADRHHDPHRCKAYKVACQEWNDLQAEGQFGTHQTLPDLTSNF